MSEEHSSSDESLDGSQSQEKQEHSEDGHNEEEDITQQRGPPAVPRVHFRSNQEFHEPPPSPEEEKSEREKIKKEGMAHPPLAPYSHEPVDVTDTPINERTEQPPAQADGESKKESKLAELNPVKAVPKTAREKLKSACVALKEKGIQLLNLLGREEYGGDELRPGAYHPDLSPGGEMPLGHVPDKKEKIDRERKQQKEKSRAEANNLISDITQDEYSRHGDRSSNTPSKSSGSKTDPKSDSKSNEEGSGRQRSPDSSSGPRNRSGGGGILSQLVRRNQDQRQRGEGRRSPSPSEAPSGTITPKKEKLKWYKKPPNQSASTLVGTAGNMSGASTPAGSEAMAAASKRRGKRKDRQERLEDEIRLTIHIAEVISRQRCIMQLCKSLMKFGAPTHRLEEYMQMTARVLEVESQYLYLPGCMIMSFDDPGTRTTEVKLVRVAQGVDLARLSDTHSVYKNVVHDIIGVEEAIQELDLIMNKKPRYNNWILVFVYGVASALVGPFAFSARPIDMPIIFLHGLILGLMRFIIAPNSALYSNIFEVAATILTSFLSRAWGSIPRKMVDGKPQYLFCFSAIAQSSIALILPGFLVLMSSLELQSHQIVAGSIRMVYAIIYSLFLGYGITVGTTIYGLMDGNATSDISCPKDHQGAFSNPYVSHFPFVTLMLFCLVVINQGKWKQSPPMLIIGLSGYICNYFTTRRLGSNSQVANTVGAFTIGVLGNLYSRLWHGHAATAILPGIFVLVPSGLAASGSLISGIESANEIRGNVSRGAGASSSSPAAGLPANGSVYSLGFGMIQVAIGITIGLFIAALLVYPYGKRRSGLFSF